MTQGPIPAVYAPGSAKEYHTDWPWPLSLLKRAWTGRGYMHPPKQIAGNAPLTRHPWQEGYPSVPGTEFRILPYYTGSETIEMPHVIAPDPVPPVGCWTLQGVYVPALRLHLPCYLAFSAMVFGRRLHFNGFLKPDLTLGDFYWWFEFSLTWTKPK